MDSKDIVAGLGNDGSFDQDDTSHIVLVSAEIADQ